MTDQQKIEEIIALITFLQRFIQNNVDQSFHNVALDLENLIKDFLNVFEKPDEKFENLNNIQHNYPAVDLVNKTKSIALQVTTNADSRKVNKTIETYRRHGISYSNLIIIGFVKSTSTITHNAKVYGAKYLIDLAKHGNSSQKDKVYEILQRRIPWNSLTPLDDKTCFSVVFDVINRSAVRDQTFCEGDFNKMSEGLLETKEIITTGRIKGKSIRAKALVEYTENIRNQLSVIEFTISQILQICNSNKISRKSDFLCLTRAEMRNIDGFKEKIIFETNRLSDELQLHKRITGSFRD